jgi:hypothetical protein
VPARDSGSWELATGTGYANFHQGCQNILVGREDQLNGKQGKD